MSKIMRQVEAEGRAAREAKAGKVAPATAVENGKAEPATAAEEQGYCTHGLLLTGACFLCGRWSVGAQAAATTQPATEPGDPWPFPS